MQQLRYRLAPSAAVVVEASVDNPGTKKEARYRSRFVSIPSGETRDRDETVVYYSRPAQLKFVKNGKVIWEESALDPAPVTRNEDLGGPDYKLFTEFPIPGMIRAGKATGALGRSDLTAAGIRDAH